MADATDDLLKANLFQLQADELLKNSKIGTAFAAKAIKDANLYSGLTRVEQFVRDLKTVFDTLPTRTITAKPGSVIAGLQIHGQEDVSINVSPPENMNLGGSYLHGTTTRPNMNVDVIIELPANMFDVKDNLNYRYFDKRAMYVAALASHLISQPDKRFADVTITNFRGDPLKPIIQLYPAQASEGSDSLQRAKGLLGKFVIRIIPSVSKTIFHPRKLQPARNCVKSIEIQTSSGVQVIDNISPTPLYNQLILEDMYILQHNFYIAEAYEELPLLEQVVSLLKVWAAQRGFTGTSVGSTHRDETEQVSIRAPIATGNAQKNKKTSNNEIVGDVAYEISHPETSVNGFILTMIVIFIYRLEKINESMSLYQAFQQTLAFIAGTDLLTAPIVMNRSHMGENLSVLKIRADDIPTEATFAASFDLVILDPSGFVNVASRVSSSYYHELRHQALIGLSYMEGVQQMGSLATCRSLSPRHMRSLINAGASYCTVEEIFSSLFLKQVTFSTQFDSYLTVTLPEEAQPYFPVTEKVTSTNGVYFAPLSFAANPTALVRKEASASTLLYPKHPSVDIHVAMLNRCFSLLSRALSDRIYLCAIRPVLNGSGLTGRMIRVGLLIRSDTASRVADQGPSADNNALATEFRAFWGSKSELRRFPDGTILETVVWKASTQHKYSIPDQIVTYILDRHFIPSHLSSQKPAVASIGHPLDEVLQYRANPSYALYSPDAAKRAVEALRFRESVTGEKTVLDAETLGRKLLTAFNDLTKNLQDMSELPLEITSVVSTHPALRGTASFPPIPVTKPIVPEDDGPSSLSGTIYEPIGVVINFSASNRWPAELLPLSRAKTAFFLKISQLFREKYELPASVTVNFVDVLVGGFAFRVRIHLEKEISLFRQAASSGKSLRFALGDGSYREQEAEVHHRPEHVSLIRGLVSQYPLLAPVARLVRRWASAHFFSRTLSLEACELLSAAVFVAPRPYTVPGSIFCGFTRVLDLIVNHDWENSPMVVPSVLYVEPTDTNFKLEHVNSLRFEVDIGAHQLEQIHSRFKLNREKKTGPHMFIATASDLESRRWTMRPGKDASIDDGNQRDFKLVASPSVPETTRLAQFAGLTLSAAKALLAKQDGSVVSWLALFKTPLELYDSFITVDAETLGESRARQTLFPLVPRSTDSKRVTDALMGVEVEKSTKKAYKLPPDVASALEKAKAQDSASDCELPVHADFSPIDLYLQELRQSFGFLADFYLDTLGGRVIAVKFKNNAFDPQVISFNSAAASVPTPSPEEPTSSTTKYVAHDKTVVLSQMSRLGEGIVDVIYPTYAQFIKELRY